MLEAINKSSAERPHLHLIADMGFADSFALRLKQLGLDGRNHMILVGKSPNEVKAKLPFQYTNLKDDNTPDPSAYDKIFVHFLLPMVTHWLKQHPRVRFHWVFYGADVYRNPLVKYNPYAPLTWRYLSTHTSGWLRHIGYHLLHRRAWKKALEQVSTVLLHNPVEFNLIRKLIPIPQARHEPFLYGKAQMDFDSSDQPRSREFRSDSHYNVQLGHCAFPSVNHLDFLTEIAPSEQVDWHLPLSYGDAAYAKWLQNKLHHRRDVRFIMDLMPIEDYLQHIGKMDAGIFPNIRQQGLANIGTFILKKIPVFMHPENPTYAYFKSLGLELGTTDRFSIPEIERLTKLAVKNRQTFLQDSGRDACNTLYTRIFS